MSVEDWPNEVQRFYFEDLKWCGCANPEDALSFMRDVLALLHKRSQENLSDDEGVYERSSWARNTAALDEMLPGPLGLSYLYMLDALDLTEHGGTVHGCWPTAYGEHVLAVLQSGDIDSAMTASDAPTQ